MRDNLHALDFRLSVGPVNFVRYASENEMTLAPRNSLLIATAMLFTALQGPAMAGGSSDAQQSFPYSGPPAEELAKIFSSSTKFPINVDANSRLESVMGKGRTLWYRYSLKSLPATSQARDELRLALTDGLERSACISGNFVKLLEDGYTLVISYSYVAPKYEVEKILLPRVCKR